MRVGALYPHPIPAPPARVHAVCRITGTAVGFSGVLFALTVQESFLGAGSSRSLFGLVNVPSKLYPWAMLVAMQLILPGVSFEGHLAGLLVGALHVRCGAVRQGTNAAGDGGGAALCARSQAHQPVLGAHQRLRAAR